MHDLEQWFHGRTKEPGSPPRLGALIIIGSPLTHGATSHSTAGSQAWCNCSPNLVISSGEHSRLLRGTEPLHVPQVVAGAKCVRSGPGSLCSQHARLPAAVRKHRCAAGRQSGLPAAWLPCAPTQGARQCAGKRWHSLAKHSQMYTSVSCLGHSLLCGRSATACAAKLATVSASLAAESTPQKPRLDACKQGTLQCVHAGKSSVGVGLHVLQRTSYVGSEAGSCVSCQRCMLHTKH